MHWRTCSIQMAMVSRRSMRYRRSFMGIGLMLVRCRMRRIKEMEFWRATWVWRTTKSGPASNQKSNINASNKRCISSTSLAGLTYGRISLVSATTPPRPYVRKQPHFSASSQDGGTPIINARNRRGWRGTPSPRPSKEPATHHNVIASNFSARPSRYLGACSLLSIVHTCHRMHHQPKRC